MLNRSVDDIVEVVSEIGTLVVMPDFSFAEFGAKLSARFVDIEQFGLATLDIVDAMSRFCLPSSIYFGLILSGVVVHVEAPNTAMRHLGAVTPV